MGGWTMTSNALTAQQCLLRRAGIEPAMVTLVLTEQAGIGALTSRDHAGGAHNSAAITDAIPANLFDFAAAICSISMTMLDRP